MEPDGTGSRLLQGLFLKQVVPGDVVEPFFTAVMLQDPWPFDEFIRTQQEVNPHDGKLEHKGCNKAQRDGVAPHINGIADKTEPAVAARPENAGDESGVDGGAHDIVGVDEKHVFQIMHGCFRKRGVSEHEGRYSQNQKASQRAAENGELHQFFRILLCGLQTVFTDYLSQQNAACAGDSEAEDGAEVTHYNYKGIGRHRIGAKVADDDGIGGKSDAPAHIISQCRQGKLYKVLEQKFVPDEHKPEIELNILAEKRNKETAGKLHNTGGCSSNGNTHNAEFGGAEKDRK